MKIAKMSKLVVCGVVASTIFFTAFASPLSLMQVQQGSLSAGDSSMWSTMSQHFNIDLQAENNPEVSKQISYLRKHQDDLAVILKRAAPYISYVYAKTQQRGFPAELALLPIVESEYNPNVISSVGATGLWQIMPETAMDLGLRNHPGYDGRRDIVASTDAALAYLNDLHNEFKKDWELALAAYNWGPANIEKKVKNQSIQTRFWDLKKLPIETKLYVPRLLALAAVIKDPARYHINLPEMSDKLQVASLTVGSKVDLKKVAESTGISVATMRKLNPGYKALATTKNAPNTVLIPANKLAEIKPLIEILAINNLTVGRADRIIKTAAAQSVAAKLLRQGEWLIVELANLESSKAYADSK